MNQSSRPTYPQLEMIVNFLEENPDIAKGHLRSSQAKWETKKKWEQITITLNAMEGTQKDAKGWSKFWIDKKYALKKILGQRNADANRTGEPANLPPLSDIEERMVAILGGRSFAEGDSQFIVPILPSQEDVVIFPVPGSPDHTPLLPSTQATPRRSPLLPSLSQSSSRRRPRIRVRPSRHPTRPTIERDRQSQIEVERDRLISIEEKRVEAELIHARALQEGMAGLAAACNNIADAIRTLGTNVVDTLETLTQSR